MSVRRIGRSWYVDVTWRGERRRIRSPENSSAGARLFEQRVRQALAKDGSTDSVDPRAMRGEMAFGEFIGPWLRDYVNVNNKPSEQYSKFRVCERALLPYFAKHRLTEIKSQTIEQYKRWRLAGGVSAKTVNNDLTVLRKALATAAEWGALESVPTFHFLKTMPSSVAPLSIPDVHRIVASADAFWGAFITFAAYTGLRYNELAALEWRDVALDATPPAITVNRGFFRGHVGPTKTYQIRSLPLPTQAVAALERLPRRSLLVFERSGTHVSYGTAFRKLREACLRAGVRPVGWHTLRHTYLTELGRLGAPLHTLQRLAGHTDIQTTMRYAHVLPAMLASAVCLLETGHDPTSSGTRRATGGQETATDSSPVPASTPTSSLNRAQNAALEAA